MDKSASIFIKMAHANIDTNADRSGGKLEGPVKAFFWLALEAIRQLTRIADANERTLEHLKNLSEEDTLSVTVYGK